MSNVPIPERGPESPEHDGNLFEVHGHTRQEAIAAGLDAVLQRALAHPIVPDMLAETRAAPIRGEGPDLPALFLDIVDDLLEQIEEAGGVAYGVRLDGLLHKDQAGLVAWGYVDVAAAPNLAVRLPRLAERPEVAEGDDRRISIRARLRG